MRNRVLWWLLGLFLVAAMVLTACGQPVATTQPQGGQTVAGKVSGTTTAAPAPTTSNPAPATTTSAPPKTTAASDTPKYGGIFNAGLTVDISGFDEGFTAHYLTWTLKQTNEELLQGDWTRGPAGTGEFEWIHGGDNFMAGKTAALAESWEFPDSQTMIFHLRKGVTFHNKPPTNGRELTSDDVVFSLNRYITMPTSYIRASYPNLAANTTITAPDRYTEVIKVKPEGYGDAISLYPDYAAIVPRDAVEKFGDLKDWRNAIGTGPFMLTDYVSNSSATFTKNPGYWGTDPVGPGKGSKLPYIDGLKYLIIPDLSTRYAALRTGKIDQLGGVSWDDAASVLKTNPELKSLRYYSDGDYIIFMHTDKKELPFSDVRVRQALYLAMDKSQIINTYYGGNALALSWPMAPSKEYAGAYVPVDKLPANVQELYNSYSPDKAKKLLADAGYPNGFKTTLVCYNTSTQVDLMSLIKSQWAKVGVDVTIDAREYAVWTSNLVSRNYSEMLYGYDSGNGTYYKMINFNGVGMYNGSYINDPKVVAAKAAMDAQIATSFDEAKMNKIFADLMPYLLEQAYVISPPFPYYFNIWTPWLKNYRGEMYVGYYNYWGWDKYVWIDQALKTQMGK